MSSTGTSTSTSTSTSRLSECSSSARVSPELVAHRVRQLCGGDDATVEVTVVERASHAGGRRGAGASPVDVTRTWEPRCCRAWSRRTRAHPGHGITREDLPCGRRRVVAVPPRAPVAQSRRVAVSHGGADDMEAVAPFGLHGGFRGLPPPTEDAVVSPLFGVRVDAVVSPSSGVSTAPLSSGELSGRPLQLLLLLLLLPPPPLRELLAKTRARPNKTPRSPPSLTVWCAACLRPTR